MPLIQKEEFVEKLTNHTIQALNNSDQNKNGSLDSHERATLPPDVGRLAINTANQYLDGRPLPIQNYSNAYRHYVSNAFDRADTNRTGALSETEQQNLPSEILVSVAALQRNTSTDVSLNELYQQLSKQGWTDEGLTKFIDGAISQGRYKDSINDIWVALINPYIPEHAEAGDRFFEALSWYTDKTQGNPRDHRLTLQELESAVIQNARKYIQTYQDPNTRQQTWKNIQKLRILEKEIKSKHATSYPYAPSKMMEIQKDSAWNKEHTIDTQEEFRKKVLERSKTKPVLVKFGLTYCMHCLLLEQLDSVRVVANKFKDRIDVQKVWWNPSDLSYQEQNGLASSQGVTSSPYFILYKDGKILDQGYAFPDEKGDGMENILKKVP